MTGPFKTDETFADRSFQAACSHARPVTKNCLWAARNSRRRLQNPKGGSINQPGVARNELPRVSDK